MRVPAMHTGLDRRSAEAAVAVAGRAPSIHNTQPWQWKLHRGALEVYSDRSRQLMVADPDGHSLLISCGAALELTQLALASQGWTVRTTQWPDRHQPDLLARIEVTDRAEPEPAGTAVIAAALRRRSDRRPFGPAAVPDEVVERLRHATAAPGVFVDFPDGAEQHVALTVAIYQADRSERDTPAFAAEMLAWTRADDFTPDGIPRSAVPHVPPGEPRRTDIPVRDFEVGLPGTQLIASRVDERPLIAVIMTEADNDRQRLAAGQAMMRTMLQAELDGVACCPLSQSVDLLYFRTRLRELMSWTGHPQMMLRLGLDLAGQAAPLTARRPLADVFEVV